MWKWLKRAFMSEAPFQDPKLERASLELGGEAIAEIVVDDYEFPWTYGHLLRSEKFERFRTYLSDVDSWPEDDPELEQVCSEVNAKGHFRLRCLRTGIIFTDIVLHHQGSIVWFRYRPETDT